MNRRITTLTLAALAITTLAGCTPTPEPTETPAASASETPTPTPTETEASAPQQDPVPAPTSQEEAVLAAEAAFQEYRLVDFELKQDSNLGAEYVSGFVIPDSPYAKVIEDTVDAYVDEDASVAGEPSSWQANLGMSYAAPVKNSATGETLEFGGVTLYGCTDNTKTEFLVGGEVDEAVRKGVFPRKVTMIYVSAEQAWMISESASLLGADGEPLEERVPQC